MSKPNILFILSDQHNAKCLSHKDHPNVKTPGLDRLAAEGVSFENAIVQNPICTPSRTSFLSGQYCHNHGYYGLDGANPGGLPTMLGHFKNFGYKTAAIGKIHCPEYWVEDDCDVFHETCDCSIGGRSKEYTAFLEEHDAVNREDHLTLPEFPEMKGQSVDGRPSLATYEESQEGWSVQKSISFMKDCNDSNEPFFVHVSLPKPHQCYTPAQEFWDLYKQDELVLPPNADYDLEGKSPTMKKMVEGYKTKQWQAFEPKTYEAGRLRKLHGYLGNISHVDHAVGELLDWLDKSGLSENTIVVYSADHGDYACEHGLMEKAPGICSDAVTRVPFLMRVPGVSKAGHTVSEIIESVDLAPTLVSLAGIEEFGTADGKDLTHLLKGEKGEVHKIGVTEFAWSKSIRKGNFRLVFYAREMFEKEYPDGFGELYNLEADPWEMKNLYFEEEYQDKVNELRSDLLDWLVTSTRPTTVLGADARRGRTGPDSSQVKIRYDNWSYPDGKISAESVRFAKNNVGTNYI
ncbi:MAG: sulfatase family protein [Planctomycetota bacterium]|jgi:choline-sulfatase/uncharacterized sulfatase